MVVYFSTTSVKTKTRSIAMASCALLARPRRMIWPNSGRISTGRQFMVDCILIGVLIPSKALRYKRMNTVMNVADGDRCIWHAAHSWRRDVRAARTYTALSCAPG